MNIAMAFTSEDEADLADLQKEFKYHPNILKLTKRVDKPEKRQISYLAYHSTLGISDQDLAG